MINELRRRCVSRQVIDQIVAEANAHLAAGGQRAIDTFGIPEAYAADLAAGLTAHVPPPRSAPGPVLVEAQGLGKRYGRRWVLRDTNLTVRAGQAAAVVGANGSGKSTFLRVCAGLLSPDEGTLHVNGTVGFCPQYGGTSDFLFPDEHFALVGVGRGMTRTTAREEGRTIAAALQWDSTERVQARHLSGGTRQKLNLALAALGDPDILLLDEPYQGFDQGTYLDFWERVWEWRDRGKAVVVVTHLLENLDRVDLVLDLMSGRTLR